MPNTSTLVMRLMRLMTRRFTVHLITFALAGTSAGATGITLPPDVSKLRPSSLPGYALALQKCGICHSADYISYQPPGLSQAQWTAEMNKMQHAYGAPLDPGEVALIGAYLAVASGGAKVSDDSVAALTAATKRRNRHCCQSPRRAAAPLMCRRC
jgi:hypothetical protein